ncbi:hypothetical protein DSM02_3883 [Leeuwenhoekiella polynyae]|uniref:Uncharacterized protein n=1 Tax=Leeuwenhoekiella polynyae TaxID=1550906 RepID=A0A4Q0NQ89_9FLAO|nr:hypothetical protein DSM02_3883 [Leeuwenhoekiella polynyae]
MSKEPNKNIIAAMPIPINTFSTLGFLEPKYRKDINIDVPTIKPPYNLFFAL